MGEVLGETVDEGDKAILPRRSIGRKLHREAQEGHDNHRAICAPTDFSLNQFQKSGTVTGHLLHPLYRFGSRHRPASTNQATSTYT